MSRSVRRVKRPIGASAVRATNAPSPAASMIPTSSIAASRTSSRFSSPSTSVNASATSTAPRPRRRP